MFVRNQNRSKKRFQNQQFWLEIVFSFVAPKIFQMCCSPAILSQNYILQRWTTKWFQNANEIPDRLWKQKETDHIRLYIYMWYMYVVFFELVFFEHGDWWVVIVILALHGPWLPWFIMVRQMVMCRVHGTDSNYTGIQSIQELALLAEAGCLRRHVFVICLDLLN